MEFKYISVYVYKSFLLSAYISAHKFDIIYLSQTYLNSETTSGDKFFEIPRYNFITEDRPSNSEQGGVSMCLLQKPTIF